MDASDEIISDIYEAAAVPAKTGVARQTELISLLAGKAPQPGQEDKPSGRRQRSFRARCDAAAGMTAGI